MKKNIYIGILLNLFLVASVLAQSPSKIISQANKAYGGEKVLKSITSWQAKGTIKRLSDGASGNYTAMASSGNL